MRLQYFPTKKLKIEPWFVNGWQSYARANGKPGLGGQILWRPKPYLDFVWNNYGLGEDVIGQPGRSRVHADYSGQFKVYDNPSKFLDKIAFTVTGDLGCEYGGGAAGGPYDPKGNSPENGTSSTYTGGVNCHSAKNGKPKQAFMGWMMYNRYWFKKDRYAVTLGSEQIDNQVVILPFFPHHQWRCSLQRDSVLCTSPGDRSQMRRHNYARLRLPNQFDTFRLEEGYRYSDVLDGARRNATPPGNKRIPTTQCRHMRKRRQFRLRIWQSCGCRIGLRSWSECRNCNWAHLHLVARSAHQPDREHDSNHGQILSKRT